MSQALKNTVKQLITATLFYSGIAWLFYTWQFRQRAVVLMYHRVLPDDPPADAYSANAIVVTPGTFERQMRFLRRFFNPVDIAQFRAMMRGEAPWLPRACLITFDDGWFDNAKYALPILQRHAVPATIFVATGYVGTKETFWQERLTRLLFAAWRLGEPSRSLFRELSRPDISTLDADEARTQIRHLVTALKSLSRAEIDRLIQRITADLVRHGVAPLDHGDDRFMTWEDARALLASGCVSIGSHAHSHAPLTSLRADEVRDELRRAEEELQSRLRHRAGFFAYPNGNYNEQVVDLVSEARYELAFTTDPGLVTPGDDPLRLKRINICEQGTESNAGFMCRLLCWL
jgi:peptidoglycan/xylan/chitin deacetylase (PgdA/CDA1 family)